MGRHLAVIPGRWQVGRTDLPASPESITPDDAGDHTFVAICMTCSHGFRAPLAEPVLGRRVAPIRVLAARNDRGCLFGEAVIRRTAVTLRLPLEMIISAPCGRRTS